MKLKTLLTLGLLFAATGCEKADPDLKPRSTVNLSHRPVNEALLDGYNLEAMDNAVIRQHTLYAYHFVQHSANLNALGQREASVLAHHYKKNPGPVNLNRGEETDAIYQARVQTLRDWLINGGVDASRITIAEGLPGGDGLSADHVVIVLDRMKSNRLSGASAPDASAGSSSNSESSNQGESTSTTTTQPTPR